MSEGLKPGDVVDGDLVAGDKDFRYETRIQSASMTFRYEVTVYRYQMPPGTWRKVGDEYVGTKWGARLAARKLRRRQIRRFGR